MNRPAHLSMIAQDGIEAMTATLQAADRVLDRWQSGVVGQREVTTAELPHVLSALKVYRDAALLLLRQEQDRARSAMALYDRQGKETS